MRNYKYEEAVVIAKEMADVLALDLLEKGLVASSITLWIAYDHRYGQEPSKATERFLDPTNSSKSIIGAVEKMYRKDHRSSYGNPACGNFCK